MGTKRKRPAHASAGGSGSANGAGLPRCVWLGRGLVALKADLELTAQVSPFCGSTCGRAGWQSPRELSPLSGSRGRRAPGRAPNGRPRLCPPPPGSRRQERLVGEGRPAKQASARPIPTPTPGTATRDGGPGRVLSPENKAGLTSTRSHLVRAMISRALATCDFIRSLVHPSKNPLGARALRWLQSGQEQT